VRLALLTEIPAPYRLPLFRALADEPDVDLRVLFLARTDPRRSYPSPAGDLGFPHEVLPGHGVVRGGRWTVVSRGTVRALRRVRPDVVVVGGWNQPAFWEALAFVRTHRVPLVTWVESTAGDARPGSRPGRLAKRLFVRASAAFLVPGAAAADYLRELGAAPGRIVVAPNASRLDAPPPREPPGEICRVLFAGRLAPEKGVDVLLRAVDGLPVELAVAGAGPERERLEAAAPANARFLGNLQPADLASAYAHADVFVLPSRSEPWGMVLNEAASAGLALVATDAAGAARELVEDGVNGFVVPAGDAGALRTALDRLAADPYLRARAGARSRELAARFTPEAWAEAVAGLARQLAR